MGSGTSRNASHNRDATVKVFGYSVDFMDEMVGDLSEPSTKAAVLKISPSPSRRLASRKEKRQVQKQ